MKYVQTVVSLSMTLALSLVQGQTPPASPIFDVRYESRRAIQVAPGQVITVNLSGFEAKRPDSTFFRVKAPLGNGTTPLEGFPDVRSADGLRLSIPAKPGDLAAIRAYGLGGFSAVEAEGLTGTAPAEAMPVPKNRYSVEYRWGHKGLSDAADETIEPESVELAAGQVVLYVVRVRIPVAPQGLAACEGRTGTNLSISLRGYQSTDTARICVAP